MDKSKKRRISGAAAVSAAAIASLVSPQAAAAAPPPSPPGLTQSCGSRPTADSPETMAFKQGFPIKWEGSFRCDSPEDQRMIYDWWKKVE
ncbi:MAG TPA: hypothetical protein VHJ78_03725 [Actinomycetota bacterium]|nr:hypothetical protein [Actinomycetota bacterium]